MGRVGGLAGINEGSISDSYARTAVTATFEVAGGLVGCNSISGTVNNCYSAGKVLSGRFPGGLAAENPGLASDSFWDIDTCGQTTSAGGIGKTTAEMKKVSTFLDAGWDFVGETANGTEDIWWIDEGQDYPRLWWEAIQP